MSSGTYAERIREARPRLSKSFQRLADYILDSYVQAALMTASELAHEVDVDAATVVRFAQTLEYSGFPELQDEIRSRVLEDLFLGPKESAKVDTLPALADRAFKDLGDAIERARRLMDPAPIEALLQALSNSKRVFILADASAQSVLDELQRHMQAVGILAYRLVTEEGALARTLSLAGEGDLLLAIDLQGETPLLSATLAQAKSLGLRSVAIVGGASFDAARRADIVLEVQRQEQNEAAALVLAALIHALGSALRWRYAEQFKQQQSKVEKVQRRLASARPARST